MKSYRFVGLAFVIVTLAAATSLPAYAVPCNDGGYATIVRAGKVADASAVKCAVAAERLGAGSVSLKTVCSVCRAAQKKMRAFNKTFKSFSASCSDLVSAADAAELTRLSDGLYASTAPLSRALKSSCR